MEAPQFIVTSKVTKFDGHGGWHFVWVDKLQSKQLKELFGRSTAWGAIPVAVTLGVSKWNTSIFYSRKDRQYLMGLKASVRKAENVKMGDTVKFVLNVRV